MWKRKVRPGPICITDLNVNQLRELVQSMGEPAFRANQLLNWIYRRLAACFDDMTNLPQGLRKKLAREFAHHSLTPCQEVAGNDGTIKTLFNLADSLTIESTLMSFYGSGEKTRHTVCVSTQVGCAMGCPFCATGQQGFQRNLSPGEIIDQVLYFARLLQDRHLDGNNGGNRPPAPVTNIVFMGMGEPLANYDSLWQAIEMLNSPLGFGLGARNMVISTAGIVPGIKRLSRETLQVGLAISLHAGDNALRNRLVPANRKYPLEQLIPACREYIETTGRRITFEYILFAGINDSREQARSLAVLLRGLNCHVNLIRANRAADPAFSPPDEQAVLAFENELKRFHIACTVRQPKGLDVNAGCGQLRSRYLTGCHTRKTEPILQSE